MGTTDETVSDVLSDEAVGAVVRIFEEECDSWLREFNYSKWASSTKKGESGLLSIELLYSHVLSEPFEHATYPSITCYWEGEKKQVELRLANPFKLGLLLTSQRLEFKHPKIGAYIKQMRSYGDIVTKFHPD